MSLQTPFEFNRGEKCIITTPDFLQLPKAHIDTTEFIDSGNFVDVDGKLCTIGTTQKWWGLVTEANFYNVSTGKVLKPSGNVEAYYSGMSIITKMFKDDETNPIKKGDLLTIVNGLPTKVNADTNTIPVFQVLSRGTDYLELVTL